MKKKNLLVVFVAILLAATYSCQKNNPQPTPQNTVTLPVPVAGGLDNGTYIGNLVMYYGDSLAESFSYAPWNGAEVLGNEITQPEYHAAGSIVPSVTQFYEINSITEGDVLTLYTTPNGTRVDIADYLVIESTEGYMLLADMQLGVVPDTSSYWSGLELIKQ